MASAFIQLTNILWAVTVHGYMEENDVKTTCGGVRSVFKIEKYGKFLIKNLKPCWFFYWEPNKLKKKYFKIWGVFFLSQNRTRCTFFQFEIWLVVFFANQNLTPNDFFNTKSCFFKKHEKCRICRFHGVKWSKTWFFEGDKFFQSLTCRKIFDSKSNALCLFFKPKSDAL